MHIPSEVNAELWFEVCKVASIRGPIPDIVADGATIYRFPTKDDLKDRAGWLIVYDHGDGVYGAAFGDFRTGQKGTWFSRSFASLDQHQQARFREHIKQSQQKDELLHIQAAQKARQIWEDATEASDGHEYLKAKGVPSFGLRESKYGQLIIPLHGPDGELVSLQFIEKNGSRKFLPGGAAAGAFLLLQGVGEILYVTEGYATAASVHQATGCPTVCAFNCGNLPSVAQVMRQRYPETKIVIAGDNDRWTPNNPGKSKAEAAAKAVGGSVVLPVFKDVSTKPTDFNDLAQLEGIEAVKLALEGPKKEPGLFEGDWHRFTVGAHGWLETQPEPLSWTIENVLLSGVVGFLVGPPATGKTFLLLTTALAVATGHTVIPGLEVGSEPGRVLVLTSEDDSRILHRRVQRLSRELFPGQGDQIRENVVILPAAGADVRLMADSPAGPMETSSFQGLLRMAREIGPKLVVLDPLARLFGGNENDNSAGTVFSTLLEKIAQETGASVLCAHHTVKRAGMDGKKFNLPLALSVDNARGASSFLGACRCMITCAPIPDDQAGQHVQAPRSDEHYIAFKAAKVSNGPRGDVHFLRTGEGGVLWPAEASSNDPEADEKRAIEAAIIQAVTEQDGELVLSDIREALPRQLKSEGWKGATRLAVKTTLNDLIHDGLVRAEFRPNPKTGKQTKYLCLGDESTAAGTAAKTAAKTAASSGKNTSASVPVPVVEPFLTAAGDFAAVDFASVGTRMNTSSGSGRVSPPTGGTRHLGLPVFPRGEGEDQKEDVEYF